MSVLQPVLRAFGRVRKEQYLVPYLMSSHPGSRLEDAVELAVYLKKHHMSPEQVQDFYPTPGTLSTAMYYTGLDPRSLKPVFVARTPEEKAMQRALLQFRSPKNRELVLRALVLAGREDLIGSGPGCLVRGPVPAHIHALAPRKPGRQETGVQTAGKRTGGRPGGKPGSRLAGKRAGSARGSRAGSAGP